LKSKVLELVIPITFQYGTPDKYTYPPTYILSESVRMIELGWKICEFTPVE
jgi:hypothetical protein